MNKETYKQMEQELITLANNHHAEYDNHLFDFEEAPFFTVHKHNVPTLADMRMLAEKYGFEDAIDSQPSWDFVTLDLGMHEFKDEDELNAFVEMVSEFEENC